MKIYSFPFYPLKMSQMSKCYIHGSSHFCVRVLLKKSWHELYLAIRTNLPPCFSRMFFLCLFMAVLGLCCCAGVSLSLRWAGVLSSYSAQASDCGAFSCCRAPGHAGFSSCGPWAVELRLNNCGASAWLLCSMWDLPRSGIEPLSPTLDSLPLSHQGSPCPLISYH